MIENKNLEGSERLEDGTTLQNVAGNIEFHQVSFAYPSRPNMVFENLSFTIPSGMTFAFVGPSGSGKSTIISMVQRFYEPNSGEILLDGNDIKRLKLSWLREQMGLVSQEPALFATTIASNILLGKENANMDQIIEAAKAANADSFIKSLPNGYNTQVTYSNLHIHLFICSLPYWSNHSNRLEKEELSSQEDRSRGLLLLERF